MKWIRNSNKTGLKRNLLLLGFLLSVVLFSICYTAVANYNGIYDKYKYRLEHISREDHNDILKMCEAVNCVSLVDKLTNSPINKVKYNKGKMILYGYNGYALIKLEKVEIQSTRLLAINLPINKDLYTVIDMKRYTLFIDDTPYWERVIISLYWNLGVFTIFALLAIFIHFIITSSGTTLDSIKQKKELEGIVQRDIIEVINHEMNVPLAVLSMNLNQLMIKLFPCDRREDSICNRCEFREGFLPEFIEQPNPCINCENYFSDMGIDKELRNHFKDMGFSIDRLNAIVKMMGNSKTIKNTNGNISIKTIVENVISTTNCYKLAKIDLEITTPGLLDKYSVGGNLTNGDMLNILYVLTNNAMEAKANRLVVYGTLINEKTMDIYVKDNGIGIKNKDGKFIRDNRIFDYGYSTKSNNNNNNKPSGLLYYIKQKYLFIKDSILISFGYKEKDYKSGRGIKLYLQMLGEI